MLRSRRTSRVWEPAWLAPGVPQRWSRRLAVPSVRASQLVSSWGSAPATPPHTSSRTPLLIEGPKPCKRSREEHGKTISDGASKVIDTVSGWFS
jgi:hypothetical protein